MNHHFDMNCPACQQPLRAASFLVWCGNGQCKSQAANNGAEGGSFEESFEMLQRNVEQEDGKINDQAHPQPVAAVVERNQKNQ